MKLLLKCTAAALMAAGTLASGAIAPVAAQAVSGIGIADQRRAVVESSAFVNANNARPTTYKAQYDAAQAKSNQIRQQLEPLVNKFNTDVQAPNAQANQAALQQQLGQIQQLREQGSQEVQEILQPVALSEAYVLEQISEKFDQAVRQAMTKRKITIVFETGATLAHNDAYDLTKDITAELNTLIPSAQLVPPQGWLPRQQREQQAAQQAAQQGQARPAAPAAQQPEGR
ncbi:periplasmic chaperone for outer membrane proteins Skp [Blastomonas natatoria]|jgi:Skp family chaperone for outer membrane proteins|uniref:Periplasmic chaperone for outer membrane proteins Skp n=1 Tax=Blastomonas natatoria TaxID=34015 RepID=A0A2V3UT23_9SPHN|nr:OmpH family outer membrane protein [Blastomonas natatoria]PXW71303.1 periplasmic chaperone for outer membrane proteins Skp [Blastomonas natatoria]